MTKQEREDYINALIKSKHTFESAYSPDIPFSLYDKQLVITTTFKDGTQEVKKHPNRKKSDMFSHAFKYLSEQWGYQIDKNYKSKDETFYQTYKFLNDIHELDWLYIQTNLARDNSFKVQLMSGNVIDTGFKEINSPQEIINLLECVIEHRITHSSNIQLQRQLKLKKLFI